MMASAWGNSWGSAWGNSWGILGPIPATPQPNLPGGGSQGAARSRRMARTERRRKEEDEVAMILQAIMPLIGTDTQQEITLGERNGKRDN